MLSSAGEFSPVSSYALNSGTRLVLVSESSVNKASLAGNISNSILVESTSFTLLPEWLCYFVAILALVKFSL